MKTKIEKFLHELLGGTCKVTVIEHQEKMLWILLFTERAILAQGLEEYTQLSRTLSLNVMNVVGNILSYKKRFST